MRHTVNKREDTRGSAGRVSAALITSAHQFVESAVIRDLYEIAAGRVAMQRSASPELQAVARRMIENHTTSYHHMLAALEMKELARLADSTRSGTASTARQASMARQEP